MGLFDRKPRYPLSGSKKIDDELTVAELFAISINGAASNKCKDPAKRELADNALALLKDIPKDRLPNQNATLYIYLLCAVRGCQLVKSDPNIESETKKNAEHIEQKIRSSYTFNFDIGLEDAI